MIKFDKRFLQRIRVPLGFLFTIVFVIFARPTPLSLSIGIGFMIVGLLIRGWASGHIKKAETLAVTGPYAFTRNPLYLGSFVLGVGFTAASNVWWLAALFSLLFIGIYLPVMRVEDGDMQSIFGEDFEEYRRHVPLFVPRLVPWKKMSGKFDFRLYLRYREYRAAIGGGVAVAALAAKVYFFG